MDYKYKVDAKDIKLTDPVVYTSDNISISESIISANAAVAFADPVSEEINRLINEAFERFSKAPMYEHTCSSCGGTVEMDVDKAIFICPYCGSHYAVNTSRINWR